MSRSLPLLRGVKDRLDLKAGGMTGHKTGYKHPSGGKGVPRDPLLGRGVSAGAPLHDGLAGALARVDVWQGRDALQSNAA
jgi:hypothetical protein